MTFPMFHPSFVAIDLAVPRLHLGTIIAGLALTLGAAPAEASDGTCPSFPAGANYETWIVDADVD